MNRPVRVDDGDLTQGARLVNTGPREVLILQDSRLDVDTEPVDLRGGAHAEPAVSIDEHDSTPGPGHP